MTVEIRVQAVKPLRNTYGHIARRFGDKPASRYQEATYDIQSEINHHYKPLWDPDRDLYDKRRTAVTMKDWYALKDPRQYYYGSYTIARAKQQEVVDRQMEFVEKRNLLRSLPPAAQQAIVFALIPLRHYEWGANTSMCLIAGYGWGTAVTQAAIMATMDRLGMAQHLSRIGLLVDSNTGDSLIEGKSNWINHSDWQPLRREVENLLATRDWFEVLVAQALVADGLLYPLFYQQFDEWMSRRHGVGLATVVDYLMRWQEENTKWVDAVIKPVVAENSENQALIKGWIDKWRPAFMKALAPLAQATMGVDGAAALGAVDAAFSARLIKLGLGNTGGAAV
jgi:phenol hydroxylase P1 protein